MHRDLEQCFPPGVLGIVYSYLSVTELPEYVTTEDDMKQTLVQQERLQPDTEPFDRRLAELRSRQAEYEHYRLYPELPGLGSHGLLSDEQAPAGRETTGTCSTSPPGAS